MVASSAAQAKDFVNPLDYKVSFSYHGEKAPVEKLDNFPLASRVTTLIANSTADTSEPWYKYEKEKHGQSLEEQWNKIKSGSYIILEYNTERRGPVPAGDNFVPEEIILSVTDNREDGFFGKLLAHNSVKEEIRAYQINDTDLVSLYCFEKTIPYLPEHYKELVQKYDTVAYMYSGISCNSYTDAMLKEIEDKKQAKIKKWNDIRMKKYGLPPLNKNDDEEE